MTIASVLVLALRIFYDILSFAILIRCIISWLPISSGNAFVRLIYALTEPVLGPVRRLIEKSPIGGGMMIDFSPVIAYIILNFIYVLLVRIIYSIF